MRIFVAGGTGALGRQAVPALIGAGHTVTALARTPQKAATLTHQGAQTVSVSLFDRTALTRALVGHDAVANLTSAIPPMTQFMRMTAWRDNERVRTEGSAAVVDAALAGGVGRLVQESVSMLYPDRGDRWIDEDEVIDSYPIAQANIAAEANAARFSAAGGAGVVLRFGLFYGPGATNSEAMLGLADHHIGFILGRPDTYMSSIHVLDAATAVVAALSVPAGTYNIVDDEPVTKRAYADALAAAAGKTLWWRGPGRGALLFGQRLTSVTRSLRVSNQRFRTATDWRPRYPNTRDGLMAMARAPK